MANFVAVCSQHAWQCYLPLRPFPLVDVQVSHYFHSTSPIQSILLRNQDDTAMPRIRFDADALGAHDAQCSLTLIRSVYPSRRRCRGLSIVS